MGQVLGRKSGAHRLRPKDRQALQAMLRDGRLVQRVTNRVRALLALDRGEPAAVITRWTGLSRSALWYLWYRYQRRGLAAVTDARRHGRPSRFTPLQQVEIERVACTEPAAFDRQLTHWDCRSLAAVVIAEGIVDTIHYTTVARLLRRASLQPHRARYWKTATIDGHFTRTAARVLWCYERVEWLAARDELVICVDEKPNLQALERRCPPQPLRPGRIARLEFEYRRHGTITFLAALNVVDGTMRGACLDANDHRHFLGALPQLLRPYRCARRLHLILDHGASHIALPTQAYLAAQPSLRAVYTPAHASWLNQAELLLRAFGGRYLDRLDVPSRQALIGHLGLSWLEYNQRYAHPFTWSWSRHDMHTWAAAHKDAVVCSKTFATVH